MDITCDLPIVQRCLIMDSVSYQLKALINKIGLLESYYMFGEDHPTISQQTLENDLINVTNTFIDKKTLPRITAEAEHQLAEWYRAKFDYNKCTLMYFKCLLLDLTDQKYSLLRDLRKYLKNPQKKSMVDEFEKFATKHYEKINVDVIDKRDFNIFCLLTEVYVRIEKLSELRKENNGMFRLNDVFKK
jgi:hypothetical protein